MSRRIWTALISSTILLGAMSGTLRSQRPGCQADARLDSASRRREAIVRARNVNARQAELRTANSRYATSEELGLKNEAGFEVRLLTASDGYMVFIRDTTDPCSSGVFSDQSGSIYDARPIRYR
jgi:hypothetical protein